MERATGSFCRDSYTWIDGMALDDTIRGIRDVIVGMTNSVRSQMVKTLPLITDEIDLIIRKRCRSSRRIEIVLDTLLSYGQLGVGESEFKRLNSYYFSFNPKYAREYKKIYRKMNK